MSVSNSSVIKFLQIFNDKVQENKQFLTDLDQAIGDGDHGINIARGMNAVVEKIDTLKDKPCSDILKTAGMTLVSTVGGASGPLYGTAFMKAGMSVSGKEQLDKSDLLVMLNAAVEGIKMRGRATVDEKTMLDCIIPAYESYKEQIENSKSFSDAIDAALVSANSGVEHTKEIIATKGRASYLGERSIGHQDPGATSMLYLIESIAETV